MKVGGYLLRKFSYIVTQFITERLLQCTNLPSLAKVEIGKYGEFI
jgi:hypothetical protein